MTGQTVVRLLIPAALVLALAGCGGQAAAEVPTVTATVTSEPEVKRVTEYVEKTPPSCIAALDLIMQAVGVMSEQMGVAADNIQAAADRDIAAIQLHTARMEGLNEKVQDLTEPTRIQVADCRSKR